MTVPRPCAPRRPDTLTVARPPPGTVTSAPVPSPPARSPRRRAAGRAGPPALRPSRRPGARPPPAARRCRPPRRRRRERPAAPAPRSSAEVGRARGPPDPHARPSRRPAARGRAAGASARGAPRPRGSTAPGPGSPARVGQGVGPGREPGCAACPRRRRRWPAARPAAPRARTSWRRARRRPARPRSSAGSAPTPRRGAAPDGPAAPCCCDPAPCPRRRGPRASVAAGVASAAPSCTSAPAGAASSAKPPPPRTTSGPSSGTSAPRSGPATRPAAGRAPDRAARGRRRRGAIAVEAEGGTAGFDDGLPAGAAAEVGQQRRLDRLAGAAARLPCSSAARRSTMPGVQKPHWLAPAATKASTQRVLELGRRGPRPWSPSARPPAGPAVTQATRAAPSTQTVQQPHWPWGLQPSLTERQRSCSRSASRREVPWSSSTATVTPVEEKVTAAAVEASLS